MTFTSFAFAYAIVMLLCLPFVLRGAYGTWRLAARTLVGVTLALCICDGVVESRQFWHFPETAGIYFLDVPLETILITFAAVTNSLILFLLFHARDKELGSGTKTASRQ